MDPVSRKRVLTVNGVPESFAEKGLERRRARAALKKDIAQGKHSLVELFDRAHESGADPVLAGLRVEWFLRSIPGMGNTKVQRILDDLGINPRATLGGLRVRQRAALRSTVQRLHRHYFGHMRGRLVVLVGPSGVGKGTIVQRIVSQYEDFSVSVSATTRPPRPGEREGEHYFFLSERQFERVIKNDGFLEWARVHGEHLYGTPAEAVDTVLDEGKHVILEIDIQGARQVKRKAKGALTIFIAPPSFEELEARLRGRGTESEADITKRLRSAKRELKAQGECEEVVVNVDVATAAQRVVDLVGSSTQRSKE